MKIIFLLLIICQFTLTNNYAQGKTNSGFELGSYNGYYSYEEVINELDSMRLLYPNLVSEKDSIGSTWEGRPIWVVKISDNVDDEENEPEVFLNSLIHGTEPMSMMVLMHYMYYLLENYGTDSLATYLVNNREIYCMPMFNPDGYFHHERKNRRDNLDGSFGVDLNRNFGYMWGYDNAGSKPSTSHIMYRGPYVFSEPEAQAVRDFCINHNFVTSNNMHYYGYWLYIPFGYNLMPTPDSTTFSFFTKMSTELNSYNPRIAFNPANGTVADWMYGDVEAKPKIFAITTEVGGKDISNYASPTNQDIWNTCLDGIYQNNIICLAPGIVEDIPYLLNIQLDKNTFSGENDQLIISADEQNNKNRMNNKVIAYILNDNDVAIDTVILKYDSVDDTSYFKGMINSPEEEGFYSLRIEHIISDINVPLYYSDKSKNLKFTNIGPIDIHIDKVESGTSYDYRVRFAVTNLSESSTIDKIYLNVFNNDTVVSSFSPNRFAINDLDPGETVLTNYAYINLEDSSYKTLNLNFEIEHNDFVYWYDTLSNYTITSINTNNILPSKYELIQNYPNPFNPTTNIAYTLLEQSHVSVKIYDILGREVKELVNKTQPAGKYEVEFDADDLTSGIYIYRIKAGNFIDAKKMILLR